MGKVRVWTGGYRETVIHSGTYNIWNGRNGGLKSDIWGVSQSKLDLGLFQDTKVAYGVHIHASVGYRIFTTDAPSCHIGGMSVFYRN